MGPLAQPHSMAEARRIHAILGTRIIASIMAGPDLFHFAQYKEPVYA
jgi:hypothetical protein